MEAMAGGKRRLATMLLAGGLACAMALVLSLSLATSQAWAGAQPGSPSLEDLGSAYTVSYKGGKDTGWRGYNSKKSPKKKIANAKSSNEEVATVEANEYSGYYTLTVKCKKAGTTDISYTFGGKKKTVKYTVVKYANPVKSFKVGGKNFAKKFAPKAVKKLYAGDYIPVAVKGKQLSGKVNLKLAKGWKIKKMWYWTYNGKNPKMKYFKNGQKISKAVTTYALVAKGKQREILYLYCAG